MPEYLNGPTVLRNRTCCYCGCELSPATITKEHLIGRRFVPRGSLNGNWNLILHACATCNAYKADLEDDISAVTMQPNAVGQFHDASGTSLQKEASRKAKGSVSRRTGKVVGLSQETIRFRGNIGPMRMEFSFVGPPQVDEHRTAALAQFQVTGLFYWLTYDEVQQRGHFILGAFVPLRSAMRDDWGNGVHRAFMREVVSWDERLVGHTADGYFGVVIRRQGDSPCWSWAFEWNRNLRTVGFLGEEELVAKLAAKIPDVQFESIQTSDKGRWRRRREESLPEAEDELFKRT